MAIVHVLSCSIQADEPGQAYILDLNYVLKPTIELLIAKHRV
jgi:hypothetical protein